LVVEGNAGLAQVILNSLLKDEPAPCEVIVKQDGVEALDYLMCRGPTREGTPTSCLP